MFPSLWLQYAGVGARSGDLFGNKSVFAKMSSSVKQVGACPCDEADTSHVVWPSQGLASSSRNPDDIYSKYEPRVLRILNVGAAPCVAAFVVPFNVSLCLRMLPETS